MLNMTTRTVSNFVVGERDARPEQVGLVSALAFPGDLDPVEPRRRAVTGKTRIRLRS